MAAIDEGAAILRSASYFPVPDVAGIGAYYRAFDQWADPAGEQTLTELTRQALEQLRAATATLG